MPHQMTVTAITNNSSPRDGREGVSEGAGGEAAGWPVTG